MMQMDIQFQGLDVAQRAVQNMSDNMGQTVDAAVEGMANLIYGITQDLAPVDTGYLVEHIVVIEVAELVRAVVSEAEYSYFVEFGHLTRSGSFVPGQYYMTRSLLAALELASEGELGAMIAEQISFSITEAGG